VRSLCVSRAPGVREPRHAQGAQAGAKAQTQVGMQVQRMLAGAAATARADESLASGHQHRAGRLPSMSFPIGSAQSVASV
jgi:hypothetical protein